MKAAKFRPEEHCAAHSTVSLLFCQSLQYDNIPTVGAVEVIWMVGIIPKHQRLLINYQVALLTDVLAQSLSFFPVVAWSAQVPG